MTLIVAKIQSSDRLLGDGFTGRNGMARRMVSAGAPNAAVQRQGQWKHGDMVDRYTRGEAAGETLKWLN